MKNPASDLPSRMVVGTVMVGVLLGTAYAASPLTVLFLAAMAGLLALAGRGLGPRERNWVWALVAVSIVLRLATVAVLFLLTDHHRVVSFFWDLDGIYLKQRALWIRDVWLGVPISQDALTRAFDPHYGWTTYLYGIAYIQYWLGVAPYGIHLFNVAVFMVLAVLLHRAARAAYGPMAALCGLGLLLFLPTPFSWSVSALKEESYLLCGALALVAVVAAARTGGGFLRRLAALVVLAVCVTAIDGLREGGFLLVVPGLCAGFAGYLVCQRRWLVALVIVLLPLVGYVALRNVGVQNRVISALVMGAERHRDNVRADGHGYKVLDQHFYTHLDRPTPIRTMTPAEGVRFAVRALVSFVIVPLPWQAQSMPELVQLPQQMLWYLLVPLTLVGFVEGLRRDVLLTWMLAGVAVWGAVAIALNSGNIGTMVRHRDTVVPFVVWLSALGAVSTASASMAGKQPHAAH